MESDVEKIEKIIEASAAIMKSLDGEDFAFVMSVLEFALAKALIQGAGHKPRRIEKFMEMHQKHLALAVAMFGDEETLQ